MNVHPEQQVVFLWKLDRYVPLQVEHENMAQWRSAAVHFQRYPAWRLSKLERMAEDTSGAWTVTETYLVHLDTATERAMPCLVCGKSVKAGTLAAAGLVVHKKCSEAPLSEGQAQELLLFAEKLGQVRSWADITILPRKKL